jgi:glycosyltransferase involved in cell wall biosynthesis
MMRVLVINTEKTWRGGERQTFYNIQGYLEKGLTVELLCLKDSPLSQKAQALGITIHTIEGNLSAIGWLATRAFQYDILHAQTAKAQTAAVLTKPFHRRPVVYTRRVDFVPHGKLTRFKYRHTDRVVAISTPVKAILENFGVPDVATIYDVVVPRALDRKRAHDLVVHVTGNRKIIIATIAALVQHKDPLTMVEAIRLLAELRQDFVFLHFGDGPLLDTVRQKISEYHLEDTYHLMGFIPDIEDVFACMDIFCMSSEEEGLGSSVLDAFVYRVPVVSTDAGGLGEIVERHGTLCPRKNGGVLAKNLDSLLRNPDLAKELADSAYHYALSVHSLEITSDQYVSLFRELLSNRAFCDDKTRVTST